MDDALKEMRSATSDLHAALEANLDIAKPDAGIAEYLDYLQDLWGWMRPFDERLWSAPWLDEVHAPARAGKLAWIEADLLFAGWSEERIAQLPRATFDPDLSDPAARFGIAYVIEGSQLGTKVLQRRLQHALGDWSPHWLQGYGAANATYWRSFLQAAEACLTTPKSRQAAARAAAQAFASLGSWFAERRTARLGQPPSRFIAAPTAPTAPSTIGLVE